MAAVCRRFGVSRKTGYKWLDRYAQQGVAGLRAPLENKGWRESRRSQRRTRERLA